MTVFCLSPGKVFSRLKFCVSEELLQGVVGGKAGVIEFILTTLRTRVMARAMVDTWSMCITCWWEGLRPVMGGTFCMCMVGGAEVYCLCNTSPVSCVYSVCH